VRFGASKVTSSALKVFVVDALVPGVLGLSLGVPGPPEPSSVYHGVIVRRAPDAALGRVLAHEVSHFLGLQHVENRGADGTTYPDPIPDTAPRKDNLMEDGVTLTAGQAFVLSRSPLLTKE
jgi:hypothetical protein